MTERNTVDLLFHRLANASPGDTDLTLTRAGASFPALSPINLALIEILTVSLPH